MNPTNRLLLPVTLLATTVACGTVTDADPGDSIAAGFARHLTITAVEAAAVCSAVNHSATGFSTLDSEAGLNVSSAQAIISHRDGLDMSYPSHDDDPFDDLHELDSVDFVGPLTLEQLREWARQVGDRRPETVESVTFLGADAVAVVWGVNRATRKELDATVALDRRAADQLVALRPFATVAAIGRVPYVGPGGLMQLRAYAPAWRQQKEAADAVSLGGIFAGVDFDESTAAMALAICNGASQAELSGEAQLEAGAVGGLIGGRPFVNLLDVVAVAEVDADAMTALQRYAAGGLWNGLVCEAEFTALSSGPTGAYAEALASFDTRDVVASYALSAWQASACIRRGMPGIEGALQGLLLDMTTWPEASDVDGSTVTTGPLEAGATGFLRLLDRSLATMAEARDARVSGGDQAAEAAYAKISDLHLEVHAVTTMHPESVYSLTMQRTDGALSEEAALLVDFDAGLVIAIHQRPGE